MKKTPVVLFAAMSLLLTALPSHVLAAPKPPAQIRAGALTVELHDGGVIAVERGDAEQLSLDQTPVDLTEQQRRRLRRRWVTMPPESAPAQIVRRAADEVVVRYTHGESSCELTLLRDTDREEVILRAGPWRGGDLDGRGVALRWFARPSEQVILGGGASFARRDAAGIAHCSRYSNGMHGPRLAVLEHANRAVAVWCDPAPTYDNIGVAHDPAGDELMLMLATPPASERRTVSTVRFGAFDGWTGAAARYRGAMEQQMGARPLWEHRTEWARQIHAAITRLPPYNTDPGAYFADLAERVDPRRALVFYWNGSDIAVFGDPTYHRSPQVTEATVEALTDAGFRWMGYHPYMLLHLGERLEQRYRHFNERGLMPENLTPRPYGMSVDDLREHITPMSTLGDTLNTGQGERAVLHPSHAEVRRMFIENFQQFCAAHRMSGAYLDIAGSFSGKRFDSAYQIREGLNAVEGEFALMKQAAELVPQLGLMSEYTVDWTVPRCFYAWEGQTHVEQPKRYHTITRRLNHPIRSAVWGPYCWAMWGSLDERHGFLMGALPELDVGNPWSERLVDLFTERRLHYGLKDPWPRGALACLRSRDGGWMAYMTTPFGEGFYEMNSDEPTRLHLGRYRDVTRGLENRPTRIANWIAYNTAGQPIGLDPQRAYPFVVAEDAASLASNSGVVVESLPEGVHIDASWSSAQRRVIRWESHGEVTSGVVKLRLKRPATQLSYGTQVQTQDLERGATISLPADVGGAVVAWSKPEPVDPQMRGALADETGWVNAMGVAQAGRAYYHGSRANWRQVQRGESSQRALELGRGTHRGYAEGWIALADNTEPKLTFDAMLPAYERNPSQISPAQVIEIMVNGATVWSTRIEPGAGWSSHAVPLGDYAGRAVLISIGAKMDSHDDVTPRGGEPGVHLAGLFVANNRIPVASASLDDVDLMPEGSEVITRLNEDTVTEQWTLHESADQKHEGHGVELDGQTATFIGEHYRYQYMSTPVESAQLTVRARLRVPITGGILFWNPGIGVDWGAGGPVAFLTAGANQKGPHQILIKGIGEKIFKLEDRLLPMGSDNRITLWLSVRVTPDAIIYETSTDGKTWQVARRAERPVSALGAPARVFVGRPGLMPNDEGQLEFGHDQKWRTRLKTSYVEWLTVTRP